MRRGDNTKCKPSDCGLGCGPVGEKPPQSFKGVVACYIQKYRRCLEEELQFYANQPTLKKAIEVAALARTKDGQHNHQRRISYQVLEQVKDNLLAATSELRLCQNFRELYRVVREKRVKGFGELAVYDTAHRVGAYLGLEPKDVYLHRGTREGARAIGLDHRRESLSVEELPDAFRRLRPHEIEDCLCIYKDELKNIAE